MVALACRRAHTPSPRIDCGAPCGRTARSGADVPVRNSRGVPSPGHHRRGGGRAGVWRHVFLLLVAVATVGMHTLGHPTSASAASPRPVTAATSGTVPGPDAVSGVRSSAAAGADTAGHTTARQPSSGSARILPRADLMAGPGAGAHHSGHHPAGHGSDPSTVCLAVLLGGVLLGALLLVFGVNARRRQLREWHRSVLRALTRAGVLGLPPPRRPRLSQLQVIRR